MPCCRDSGLYGGVAGRQSWRRVTHSLWEPLSQSLCSKGGFSEQHFCLCIPLAKRQYFIVVIRIFYHISFRPVSHLRRQLQTWSPKDWWCLSPVCDIMCGFVCELSALSSKFLMKILNRPKPRADPHDTSFQNICLVWQSNTDNWISQCSILCTRSCTHLMVITARQYFPCLLIGKLHWIGLWVLKRLRYNLPPAPLSSLIQLPS